jgi:hypothetical protein
MRIRSVVALVAVVAGVVVFAAGAGAKGKPKGDQPTPIARGAHISGVARYQPKPSPSAGTASGATCSAPGAGNYRTDCNSSGRPVNETWVTYGAGAFYAGANDYNSYNGQGQDGFYWSSDGTTWHDAGPIDVFPHNNNNGAGDPGLVVDSSGVVYYSSLMFNFYRCNVGGVELLRRDPSTGSWSYYQIAANSSAQFQDKPAIALDDLHHLVYVSWTQFGSCSGANVTSPIKVAELPTGTASVAPSSVLPVPGSTYSQGSTIKPDGAGGFWVAWEEWPSATAGNGEIRIAHYTSAHTWVQWAGNNDRQWETISEPGFTDLPSTLNGFAFRTNSFPAMTVTNGVAAVVWCSFDGGVGRTWLWKSGSGAAAMVSNSGGDQFFPSIAPDGSGGVYVAYSQVNAGKGTYDQWLSHDSGAPARASTASSGPSQDAFFSGQFIGDYNGIVFDGSSVHPIWTDIRGSDPNYPGWEMDSMIASQAASTQPAITFTSKPLTLTAGASGQMSITVSGTASVLVSLGSSSPGGGFSGDGNGFTPTLSLQVGPGGASFYYEDTKAGSPLLTATADGYTTGTQTETVVAGPMTSFTVTPSSADLQVGQAATFTASGTDAYQNPVDVSGTTWTNDAPGSLDTSNGASVTFTAGSVGSGMLTASSSGLSATASINVTQTSQLPAPTGLSVAAHGKHISISWQPVNGAASYNLYKGPSGGETLYQSGLTSTSVNDMNVKSGTTYWYYVTAVAPDGSESPPTPEQSATVK